MKESYKLFQLFWHNKIKDKPQIYSLTSKINSCNFLIDKQALQFFFKITNNNILAQFSILSAIYSFLLNRYFDTFTGIITSYNSLIKDKGVNNPFFLELGKASYNKPFKEYITSIVKEIQNTLAYIDYTPDLLRLDLNSYSYYALQLNCSRKIKNEYTGVLFDFKTMDETLHLIVHYNDSLTNNPTIQHLSTNFVRILKNLDELIDKNLQDFNLLSTEEEHKLLIEFNNTEIKYSENKTIIHLFEEQVNRAPENLAIIYEDKKINYKDVNELANQLGNYLQTNYNIQPDDLIGVKLERSEWLIVTILGILKSGAAYVPIDSSYPQERIEYVIKDANLKVLIDEEELTTFKLKSAEYNKADLLVITKPEHLAYCIYTSGSTGKPKGVLNGHEGLYNRLLWMRNYLSINSKDIFLQKTPYTFDVSVWELLLPLITGSVLVIAEPERHKDPIYLQDLIEKRRITIVHFVPSMLNVFLVNVNSDKCRSLSHVICSGEVLTSNIVEQFRTKLKRTSIHNFYGPTEAAIDVTAINLTNAKVNDQLVSIGYPVPNTKIYIVNETGNLQPMGLSGELLISGVQVAKGYLNLPQLTKERFIQDPFTKGNRVYRTGDIAKWLPDGSIQFLGRKDHQLKIRGYRIEPGEIESIILEYSNNIKHVVVDAKETSKEKVLVAYYASSVEIDKTKLKNYLQQKLPEYMIPSFYIALDSISLTTNGKIDRKTLPDIKDEDIILQEYIAPRNKIEQKLVEIWQELLEVKKIGVKDNFFELGGHSLLVTQILNSIYKTLSQTITFKEFFEGPTIESVSRKLQRRKYISIPEATEMESYPLTPSQQRLWILTQLEGTSQAYNISAAVKLHGQLEKDRLQESFNLLIKRHEILRTYFKTNEFTGEVRQYILPKVHVDFKIEIKNFNNKRNEEGAIENCLQEISRETFNLEKAPLLRASLLGVNPEEYIFFIELHHIIGDGWSIELLISEIIQTYNALVQEKDINLPSLNIQYKDYAVWLNEEIKSEQYQKCKQYWLKQFEGEVPVLNLAGLKSRPIVQTYCGSNVKQTYSKTFLDKLKGFSQQNEVTLFMTLMAGIKVLLYRYSGQQDIIIGTPVAGREHPDLENQLGPYLNTLAIRTQIEEKDCFLDLLKREKQLLIEAYEYQSYPFDELVGELNLKRDLSRSALFDIMVVLQSQHQINALNKYKKLKDIEIEFVDFEKQYAKFDLSFDFVETDTLDLTITYNTDIYDANQVNKIFNHLENILEVCINHFKKDISTLEYITQAEREQLLFQFNATTIDYPKDKTVINLFEEQVEKTPDAIALIFEGKRISFKTLSTEVNLLANYLSEKSITKGDRVILCFDTHLEQAIIGLLAVLKLGAVYVPIDSDYPFERLQFIIEDTQPKCIISNSLDLHTFQGLEVVLLDKIAFGKTPSVNIQSRVSIIDPAYIIYTSGSTGAPKGVIINHQNLNDYLFGLSSKIPIIENTSYGLMSTLSTDLGNTVLFSSLIFGGSLHLFSKSSLRDTEYIKNYFSSHLIDCIKITPSYWKSLNIDRNVQSPRRVIIFGGEELTIDVLNKIKSDRPALIIVNHYGPTETTIGKLLHIVKKNKEYLRVPIGQAFSNTCLLVVNENLCLCPIGVEGELLIGGDGVSEGYWNNVDLTKEKFIQDTFYKTRNKIYKTGDRVIMYPNGDIEFRGRIDNQVKILGHRIELGEIDKTINNYPGVKTSVSSVFETRQGIKKIVSYIVYEQGDLPVADISNFLRKYLPFIMVPSILMKINAIPFTSNGKVNRKLLPNVSEEDVIRKEYSAPRNAIEEKLVEIWQEVLKIDQISIKDNFFELGGHSLIVVQVINKLFKILGKQITFKHFFANPTIQQLGDLLTESTYIPIPLAEKSDSYPVTSSQKRLWILSQFKEGSLAYNTPIALKLKGNIDFEIFKESFRRIISRHEILRTYFKVNEQGELRQFIVPEDEVDFMIEIIDYKEIETKGINLESYLVSLNNQEFNLEKAPLVRAILVKISADECVFFFSRHHIIGDGWSSQIMANEIIQTYNLLLKGEDISLPLLKIQYKDYAMWLKNNLDSEKNKSSKLYWLKQFSGEIPALELPSFKSRPLVKTNNGNTISYSYSKEFLDKLKLFSKSYDVTLFMTLMTGIKVLLYQYSGQRDIVIGTPIAGREHPDLENQLGAYLNTLAIRTQIEEKDCFLDLLKKEKQLLIEAYEHQNYPFDELVNQLSLKRDVSRSALFDVMVVLQSQYQVNDLNIHKYLKGIEIEALDFEKQYAKFDLTFVFVETDTLDLTITYNTDIYDIVIVERIFKHLENILEICTDHFRKDISTLQYITKAEREQLLFDFNNTGAVYSKDKTVVDLFEEQVQKTPVNIAIVFESKGITYKELNEQANQLGNYLRENYNIKPDDLVGIKLERSEWLIITILGILKSGAAYVPIDPNYPQERIKYIENDTRCKIIIDEIELQNFYSQRGCYSITNPKKINSSTNLAYVIYTSGTTGNPKGVMIENVSVINLIQSQSKIFAIRENERILQLSSYSFDASVEQIFLAMLNGSSLYILSKEILLDENELEKFIITNKITHFHAAPYILQKIKADHKYSLKRVIAGGDICSLELAGLWSKICDFYNEYGPTETTVTSTEYQHLKNNFLSIGRPISNTQVYILNDNFQPVPTGVSSKLYISGVGVARGYLNKPELTAEKFLVNPFIPGTKMYDTGDIGRWLPDGNIEFLGRKDDQVKIRGYRIELGEIEHVIMRYAESLKQALVIPKEYNQEKVLVAYLVASHPIDKLMLRNFLRDRLPEYMVPIFYIILKALPLTFNGKVDKKALPDLVEEDIPRKDYIAPRSKIEKELVVIWKEVLGIKRIGIADNFFELGGNSILLIKLFKILQTKFGHNILLADLFIYNNISSLAIFLNEKTVIMNNDIELLKF